MTSIDEQTDHREMSEEAIRREIVRTRAGDEVRFNDRIEPLTVTDVPAESREWAVVLSSGEAEWYTYQVGRTRDDVPFEEGTVVDADVGPYDPPYTVERVERCTCPVCQRTADTQLELSGPRDGEYRIHVHRGTIRCLNTSADSSFHPGERVEWFENLTRDGRARRNSFD